MTERADCISIQGISTPKAGKNCVRVVPGKQQYERHRTTEMKLTKRMVTTVNEYSDLQIAGHSLKKAPRLSVTSIL